MENLADKMRFRRPQWPTSIFRFWACVLVLLCIASALAWNDTGHMTVAELAWRRLSKTERTAIGNLLRQHPHYSLFLTNDLKAGVDESEWAFLKAATWPDFVRSTNHGPEVHSYHRPTWHYTNAFLVIPPATAPAASQDVHILQALADAVETLKDHTRPAPERAVSLCWLLHLVGDLHQPLH